jgi:tRNA threonylcarbamoyladenosine biosynthesis protein TsaE
MQKIFTRSISGPEAMRQLAKELCENNFPTDEFFTLFLDGSLGAGKTFLAQEILKHKGITEEITSPTYALVNEYQTKNERLCHWDFYRLESPNDFFARGFQDLAGATNSNHLVEWSERLSQDAKDSFDGLAFTLKIDFCEKPDERNITLFKSV